MMEELQYARTRPNGRFGAAHPFDNSFSSALPGGLHEVRRFVQPLLCPPQILARCRPVSWLGADYELRFRNFRGDAESAASYHFKAAHRSEHKVVSGGDIHRERVGHCT